MKKSKGITLVALIITIIIMLILIAVTVSLVVNSNLLGRAKDAGDKTKTAYEQEANYGEVLNINGKLYASPEDYIAGRELGQENLGDWIAAWVQTSGEWNSTTYYWGDKTDEELEAMGEIVARLYENGGTVTHEGDEGTWTANTCTLVVSGTGIIKSDFWPEGYITELVVNNGITGVEGGFLNMESISSITMADSVIYLSSAGFGGPAGTRVVPGEGVYLGKVYLELREIRDTSTPLIIAAGTLAIADEAMCFPYEAVGSALVLPSGLRYIGRSAFDHAGFYDSALTIPSSVETIGPLAFWLTRY